MIKKGMIRFRRKMAAVLAAAMLLGEVPMMPTAMRAEANDEITNEQDATRYLGSGALSNPVSSNASDENEIFEWKGSYVYYGKYDGNNATKYRVLDKASGDFGVEGGSILLDCDSILFNAAFGSSADWSSSDVKANLNGNEFLNKTGNLSDVEKAAIAASTKAQAANGDGKVKDINFETYAAPSFSALSGEKIFLLDVAEAARPSYGYPVKSNSGNRIKSKKSDWWLRSQTGDSGVCFASYPYYEREGYVNVEEKGDKSKGVSPAFNIGLLSVIFSSTTSEEGAYKLTISDNDLGITAGDVTYNSESGYTIPYTISDNSDTSEPTQVSVVVTNGTWTDTGWSSGAELKQYAKLIDVNDGTLEGTATFALDSEITGTWGEDYHVYILAEDINGEKETDYASAPVELEYVPTSEENGEEATELLFSEIPDKKLCFFTDEQLGECAFLNGKRDEIDRKIIVSPEAIMINGFTIYDDYPVYWDEDHSNSNSRNKIKIKMHVADVSTGIDSANASTADAYAQFNDSGDLFEHTYIRFDTVRDSEVAVVAKGGRSYSQVYLKVEDKDTQKAVVLNESIPDASGDQASVTVFRVDAGKTCYLSADPGVCLYFVKVMPRSTNKSWDFTKSDIFGSITDGKIEGTTAYIDGMIVDAREGGLWYDSEARFNTGAKLHLPVYDNSVVRISLEYDPNYFTKIKVNGKKAEIVEEATFECVEGSERAGYITIESDENVKNHMNRFLKIEIMDAHSVTFKASGETVGEAVFGDRLWLDERAVALAVEAAVAAAPEGKVFAGWSETENGGAFDFSAAITENKTFHAIYEDASQGTGELYFSDIIGQTDQGKLRYRFASVNGFTIYDRSDSQNCIGIGDRGDASIPVSSAREKTAATAFGYFADNFASKKAYITFKPEYDSDIVIVAQKDQYHKYSSIYMETDGDEQEATPAVSGEASVLVFEAKAGSLCKIWVDYGVDLYYIKVVPRSTSWDLTTGEPFGDLGDEISGKTAYANGMYIDTTAEGARISKNSSSDNGIHLGKGSVIYVQSPDGAKLKLLSPNGYQNILVNGTALTSAEECVTVAAGGSDRAGYSRISVKADAEAGADLKKLEIIDPVSAKVTFKVVNGSWDDGTTSDKTVTVNGFEGLKLSAGQIPAVGNKPGDIFKTGGWDVTPSVDTEIIGDKIYTYTYTMKSASESVSAPTARKLIYNGSAQDLVNPGSVDSRIGTLKYAVTTEEVITPPTDGWSTFVPKGTDAGKYYVFYEVVGSNETFVADTPVLVTIDAKPVVVSGITAGNKTYDGTTAATLNYSNVRFDGNRISSLSVTAIGTFENADAGTNKTVNISGITLDGSANYTLAESGQQSTTKADITKAEHANKTISTSVMYGNKGTVDLETLMEADGSLSVGGKSDSSGILDGEPSVSGKVLSYKIKNNTSAIGKIATVTVKAGSKNYQDYNIVVTISALDKAAQVVTFTGVTDSKVSATYGDDPFTKTASTAGDGAISYSSSNTDVAVVDSTSGKVTVKGAGTASITATAAETDTYKKTSASYTLTVEAKEVGLTWNNTTLTFNGSAQAPTAMATGCVNNDAISVTVTGSQTNAGVNYTATASALTGDKAANYKLPEANTTQFTINKAAAQDLNDITIQQIYSRTGISVSVAGSTLMPGDAGDISYTAAAAIKTGSVSVTTWNVNNEGQVTATISGGKADDTVTLPVIISSTNYADSTVNVVVTLVEKEVAEVSLTDGAELTKTYGDADFKLTASVPAGSGDGTWTWNSSDTDVAAVTEDGTVHIIKAGSTKITAEFESDTHTGSAELALTVNAKPLGITWSNTSFSYDSASHVPTATITGVKSGDTCTVSVTGAQTDAGTYTATASLAGTDKDNYTLPADKKTCSFTIGKVSLRGAVITLGTALTYNGNEQTQTVSKVELNGVTVPTAAYTITNNKGTNAGSYTLTVTAKEESNYTGSLTAAFTIAKKAITPTVTVTGSYSYTGSAVTPAFTVKDGGRTLAVTEYTSELADNINAGTAKLTVKAATNGNYSFSPVTREFSITKAKAKTLADITMEQAYVKTGITASVAGLMPQDAGTLSYTAGKASKTGKVSVTQWSVSSTGQVTATISGGAAGDVITLPVKIGSTNYEDSDVKVIVTLISKTDAGITVTDGDSIRKTYGDAAFKLNVSAADPGTGNGVWTYVSADTGVATISSAGMVTIVGIGQSSLTAKYESDTTIGEVTVLLTVEKKAVTITGIVVSDKEYDGTTAATVANAGSVNGAVAGDDVSVKAGTAVFADKNAGNDKPVIISGFELTGSKAANYTLSKQPEGVTANITPKALTATVSAVSRAYEKDNLNVAISGGSVSGVLDGEEVAIDTTAATGTMADANAGKAKPVTVLGVAISGKDAANYSVSQPSGVTVDISKIDLPDGQVTELTRTYLYTEEAVGSLDITGIRPQDCGAINVKAPVTSGDVSFKEAPTVKDGIVSYKLNKADNSRDGVISIVTEMQNYNDHTYKINIRQIALALYEKNGKSYELCQAKEVNVDKSFTLVPMFADGTVVNQKVVWTSTDPEVVSVTQDGKVSGKAAGKATVSVMSEEDPALIAYCEVTVTEAVAEVILDQTKAALGVGESITLTAKVIPYTAEQKMVWSVDNENIKLKVSEDTMSAVVTGVNAGKSKITVTAAADSKKKASCTVTVGNPVPDFSITAKGGSAEVKAGKTLALQVKWNGDQPKNTAITWTVEPADGSNAAYIASVSDKGIVTGITAGKVNVKAVSVANPEKSASIAISVTAEEKSAAAALAKISITNADKVEKGLAKGKGVTLKAKATVSGNGKASADAIAWISSDDSIATVSQKGAVKAVAPGSVTITAIYRYADDLTTAASDSITFDVYSPVKSVKLDKKKMSIGSEAGNCYGIISIAIIEPEDVTDPSISWTANNSNVALAVIPAGGRTSEGAFAEAGQSVTIGAGEALAVKGLIPGVTKLTGITTDGSKKKVTCTVTVRGQVSALTLNTAQGKKGLNDVTIADVETTEAIEYTSNMKAGGSMTVKPVLSINGVSNDKDKKKYAQYKKYTDTSVSYRSSDTSVLTVDKNGKIKVKKDASGKSAIVYVSSADGKHVAEITVKVQ